MTTPVEPVEEDRLRVRQVIRDSLSMNSLVAIPATELRQLENAFALL